MYNYFINNLNVELDNYKKLFNKMIIVLKNQSNYQNIKNILNVKKLNVIKDINIFLKDNLKNKFKYLINKFYIPETMNFY